MELAYFKFVTKIGFLRPNTLQIKLIDFFWDHNKAEFTSMSLLSVILLILFPFCIVNLYIFYLSQQTQHSAKN